MKRSNSVEKNYVFLDCFEFKSFPFMALSAGWLTGWLAGWQVGAACVY